MLSSPVVEGQVGRVRVAFIGCGVHSTENLYPCLRYLADRVELVATCDLREELARRNARYFGFLRWYTDYREMLGREELDAVFVVGPPQMHYEIGLECLENGLHVFVEKPPALSSRMAWKMVEAARESGRYLMVGFMKRFAIGYRLAREVVERGEFGRVTHILTKFVNGPYSAIWGLEPPARAYLVGQAIHHFDLARYLVGEVERVYAELYELDGERFTYAVTLRFENGATGTLNLGSCQSWSKIDEYVEVAGEGCFIYVDDMASQVRYYPRSNWLEAKSYAAWNQGLFWEANHLPVLECQSRYLRGYYGEVEHFINSILEGRQPSPDIEDGYRALRIAEAVWESAVTGKPVEVSY